MPLYTSSAPYRYPKAVLSADKKHGSQQNDTILPVASDKKIPHKKIHPIVNGAIILPPGFCGTNAVIFPDTAQQAIPFPASPNTGAVSSKPDSIPKAPASNLISKLLPVRLPTLPVETNTPASHEEKQDYRLKVPARHFLPKHTKPAIKPTPPPSVWQWQEAYNSPLRLPMTSHCPG
ncbi:unknown [Bacteroides sp. CAG:189]|nr:unknown [Bacteroides sp. CAG:189]